MNQLVLDQLLKEGYPTDLLNNRELQLTSLIDEVIFTACKYYRENQALVVIKSNSFEASQFYDLLVKYVDEDLCALFIPEESMRVEAIASSPENRAQTLDVLSQLSEGKIKIVVSSVGGAVRNIPSRYEFNNNKIRLKLNQSLTIKELKEKLIKAGYRLYSTTDQPLTFSVRGGIVDIFSINYDQPIRVEFFDTEIDSIRFFDIQTQRTIKAIYEVTITPATYILFNDEELKTITNIIKVKLEEKQELREVLEMDIDYLNNHIPESHLYLYYSYLDNRSHIVDYLDEPVIITMDYKRVELSLKTLMEDTITYIQEMATANKMIKRFSVFDTLENVYKKYLVLTSSTYHNSKLTGVKEIDIPEGNVAYKIDIIKRHPSDIKVFFINEKDAETIMNELINQKIEYNITSDKLTSGVNLVFEELDSGFEFNNLYVVANKELFIKRKLNGKYVNKYKESTILESYEELNKKDYVVHNQYGIGQYMGMITKEYQGIHRDYLQIIYAENDELLIPIDQFHLIRKYASSSGAAVKLHKLGTNKWQKTKERVQANVRELASKLSEIYSERKAEIGHQFKEDSDEQDKFENEFEYELTDDQRKAVIEVKKDMESPYPMDRLLCGDVGFGKTEVAIRAAFKAVYEGKQVAFLCPTTVLSMQHYQTFLDRFKHYPIQIEVINRFISSSKQKEIIKGIKERKVDILIGTHRILSKDIQFFDLGLLVIDEEQRFGVEHKEKIKQIKTGVDVLSLSATPIPRTLQMSLIGMRQLSTLNTPPLNRLPVLTYVVEKTSGLIVEIIQRELQRKGQAFYLYNNISHIFEIQRNIKAEIPDAKVGVVHGQMSKDEIEDVMLEFNLNIINVLVCTTIIETGIDIPNANTIIIENAHKFGLAQLYQIKGRVGRSSRLAYAYLLIPKNMQVSEVQEKRLKAIKEFTELGSGYKIAQRDLTIRGAGEILGPQQSGFIDSVGIDLYLDMLKEAIDEEKGAIKKENNIRKTNIKVDNYIPEAYAPYDFEKIGVYKKIQTIDTLADLYDYEAYITDRHGKMPKYVVNVFRKKEVDLYATEDYVANVKETSASTIIELTENFSDGVDGVKLFEFLNVINKNISISYRNQKITINIPQAKNQLSVILSVLKGVKECRR